MTRDAAMTQEGVARVPRALRFPPQLVGAPSKADVVPCALHAWTRASASVSQAAPKASPRACVPIT